MKSIFLRLFSIFEIDLWSDIFSEIDLEYDFQDKVALLNLISWSDVFCYVIMNLILFAELRFSGVLYYDYALNLIMRYGPSDRE